MHKGDSDLATNGILLQKLFLPSMRKNSSSYWEKRLKFEAEGREFAKFLRYRTISGNRMLF